jgi:hypothetical protein
MLKNVGAFSKDPILETRVTVCGASELDAGTNASMDLAAMTSYVAAVASYCGLA